MVSFSLFCIDLKFSMIKSCGVFCVFFFFFFFLVSVLGARVMSPSLGPCVFGAFPGLSPWVKDKDPASP